jgi:hypothetical protein
MQSWAARRAGDQCGRAFGATEGSGVHAGDAGGRRRAGLSRRVARYQHDCPRCRFTPLGSRRPCCCLRGGAAVDASLLVG